MHAALNRQQSIPGLCHGAIRKYGWPTGLTLFASLLAGAYAVFFYWDRGSYAHSKWNELLLVWTVVSFAGLVAWFGIAVVGWKARIGLVDWAIEAALGLSPAILNLAFVGFVSLFVEATVCQPRVQVVNNSGATIVDVHLFTERGEVSEKRDLGPGVSYQFRWMQPRSDDTIHLSTGSGGDAVTTKVFSHGDSLVCPEVRFFVDKGPRLRRDGDAPR